MIRSVGVPKTWYAPVGEFRVAYQVWGEGPVDLVTVWGTMSHIELHWEFPAFARLLERLGRSVRVIQFDRLGSGVSDRPDRLPTLDDRLDALRAVIDAVGCERVALLGESEGGAAAMLFAATSPERVSHLVLYGSVARVLRSEDFPIGPTREEMETIIESVVEHYGEGSTWKGFHPDATPEQWEQGARYMRMAGGPKTFRDAALAATDVDVRPILKTLRLPTLVVYKTDDALVAPEHGRYLAEHIPGAVAHELDGRGHSLAADDPDDLVDVIVQFLTGTPPHVDTDRVLVTVMFTDIVESTSTLVTVGDERWHRLLDEHDRVVRDIVTRFRGRVIKPTGDSVLATFDGPARAVQAGEAIVANTHRLGLESRVGVHTGEVILRPDDIGGVSVHVGARIAALANPGQVLVSRTVLDLVAGSQLAFHDAGTHTLRGVPGTWPLFALGAPAASIA